MWGGWRGVGEEKGCGVTPALGGRAGGNGEDAGLWGEKAGGREGRSGEDRGKSG